MDWASQVYYRMAVLLGDRPGADRKALLSLLDRGLAQDEHNQDCLCYKAWLLAREERTEEALEIYTRLEARPSHSIAVERGLAELAYEDLDRKAPEALARYQKLLARQEDPAPEEEEAFSRAMARLSPRYRELLLLKHWQGFSDREIGKMLSMSQGNVARTLQRAKEKLREALKEEGVEV